MNALQRKSARQKRVKHQVKQALKPAVKAQCRRYGIDYAGFELRDHGREIMVRGKDGEDYVSRMG